MPVARLTELSLNSLKAEKQTRFFDSGLANTAVTKRDVLAITDTLQATPSERLHLHRALRAFFNWCLNRDYVAASPLMGLNAPASGKTRDRVLFPEEVKFAYSEAKIPEAFRRVIRACIHLGTRQGETTAIQPSWITAQGLLLPATTTKNGREHLLPLTDTARKRVLEVATNLKPNWNSWNKIKKNAGWPDCTIHDLRRTFATTLASIGVEPHIIERLLSHSSGQLSGVAAIYNRHHYLPEMRVALELYEAHLEKLLGEPLIS